VTYLLCFSFFLFPYPQKWGEVESRNFKGRVLTYVEYYVQSAVEIPAFLGNALLLTELSKWMPVAKGMSNMIIIVAASNAAEMHDVVSFQSKNINEKVM